MQNNRKIEDRRQNKSTSVLVEKRKSVRRYNEKYSLIAYRFILAIMFIIIAVYLITLFIFNF